MGLVLGVGVGLATFSLRNILKGGVGGLIGGFVGGLGFDLIGSISQTGLLSRLTGFCVIGLAIGFFIGLVQELTKAAWLAVEGGRLKGRQFRLEGATVMVGRAEENPVGLFGDPGVQPRHAVIERRPSGFMLKNLAVQAGTIVNGNRIESVELHNGDRVRISDYELSFHERAASQAMPSASGQPSPREYQASHPASHAEAAASSAVVASTPTAVSTIQGAGDAALVGSDGQRFAVHRAAATQIGRALDNDIVVNDASVSRHHVLIESRNGAFVVRDLGSQNGTWLGDQRIGEAPLEDGDSVKLGDAVFTFHA
jgi:pSer/pThr/pTyr-binding forkhead associated (FHA) protein